MAQPVDPVAVEITEALLERAQEEAVLAIQAAMARGFEPPPRQTVSEWADAHRVLTKRESPEPGPWRTSRTPYLREIMDALSIESPVERVVFMKGAQIGGSEVGNNWLGYILSHPPAAAPTMVVLPTVDMARRMSRQRLDPLIQTTPEIRRSVRPKRSRDGGNTILAKEFANGDGLLVATGANSAAGLRAMSVRWMFPDEVDAYPLDVEGEGDPLELLEARSSTFGRKAKVFLPSTPTVKGESRIEALWEDSDRRRYFVPCPDCGEMDWIRWERIKWQKDRPETAALVCLSCGILTPESKKPWMLEHGEWRPTAEGPPNVRGYHLSALYSPLGWKSWERCVRQFLRAKRDKERTDRLKTWTNTVLGETWEESGETLSPEALLARREKYQADIPQEVLVLTAGVDVQDNRLEWLVRGWTRGEESWAIAAGTVWGDPEAPDVWVQLDQVLAQRWDHALEGVRLGVSAVCVDSGYKTDAVYKYVQERQARRVWATKGRAGEGLPITSAPSRKKLGPASAGWVDLFTLGVDTAKGLLYSRLRLREPGPGFLHYPEVPTFDEEWMAQVCAEKRRTTYHHGRPKRLWVKTRARNEALDLEILSLAALYLLNPVWDALASSISPREGREPSEAPPGRRLNREGGWVNRWKR